MVRRNLRCIAPPATETREQLRGGMTVLRLSSRVSSGDQL